MMLSGCGQTAGLPAPSADGTVSVSTPTPAPSIQPPAPSNGQSASPHPDYVSVVEGGVEAIFAGAQVHQPYELQLGGFGKEVSGCGLVPTASASSVGVSFQATFHYADLSQEPRLEITDDGQGTIIGGLFAYGEEWEFTQPGSMSLEVSDELWVPVRLERDDDGSWAPRQVLDGRQPDGFVFEVDASWRGTATENFSSEQADADLEVTCIFASTVLLHYVEPGDLFAFFSDS